MDEHDIMRIEYRFRDAPVPPDAHRSFSITLSSRQVRLVVDSYGTILVDRQYPVTERQFADIVSSLHNHKITKNETRRNEDLKGCTGGTIEYLTLSGKGGESFSGELLHCGGRDTGDLEGDIKAFVEELKRLIPDFYELMSLLGLTPLSPLFT